MSDQESVDQDETVEKGFMTQIKTIIATVIAPPLIILISGGVLKFDEYLNIVMGGVTLISCVAALIIYKAYTAVKQDRETVRLERESAKLDNEELKKEIATLGYEMNVMAETTARIPDEINKDREQERDDLIRTLDESFKDTFTAITGQMTSLVADIMLMKREIAAELNYKSTKKYRQDVKTKEVIPDGKERIIRTG